MSDRQKFWKGFEFTPMGCLLEQVIEESPGMGIAYERSCNFLKDFHTHDRMIIIFPRASCEMEVRTKGPAQKFRLDDTNFLIVPAGIVHDDEGVTAIYDTVALLPEDSLIIEVAKTHGKNPSLKTLKEKCRKLKRTSWLSELLQQYFFERIVNRTVRSEDIKFLERKILAEIFAIASGTKNEALNKNLTETNTVKKAITFIESNLFSKIETQTIAKQIGVGIATLFRQFKNEVGASPYAYIKRRRLEEAMRLLKTGKYSVSEVALLVGYENFGAFTDAFKSKYKKLPSAI
ncbi:MAG: hypothetical protein A4S09_16195 [Proteobacteria bacterium SG_bin7]|nr:MAG: hypothetical protein A4S09_16195 [Proteobacteria bacterium SG_bin7]